MRIKPITDDAEHAEALAEIDRLMVRNPAPGTASADRLGVLATLVESYEDRRWPIEAPDPVEAILFAMEQRGYTRKDLEAALGSRQRVSEILNKRRRLTMDMAWNLHRQLGIPAGSLVKPYELAR
jgi:HTH-type transcriptional regulator/antitoxin HigA